MTDAAQNIWNTISNWKPNQWLITFGILGIFFFGSGGVSMAVAGQKFGFVPAETHALLGMLMSFAMVGLGSWYAKEAARYASIERSKAARPNVPVSELSLEFARQIKGSIRMDEADTLRLLKVDADKTKSELIETLKRMRLREAAGDRSVIYYDQGMYHSRSNDATVLAK